MKCSFCGRDQEEVKKLIAANDKIAICDGCVMDCLATLVYPDEVVQIELDDDITLEDSDATTDSGC